MAVLSLIGEVEEDIVGVSATAPIVGTSSFVRFFTPYLALSLGTTLYTTCMIIGRILSVAIGVRESGIKRSLIGRYFVIIEILVESALLYSLTILIFVILLARESEHNIYPDSILSQVSVSDSLTNQNILLNRFGKLVHLSSVDYPTSSPWARKS